MPGSRLDAVLRANPTAPTGAVWSLGSSTSSKAVKIGIKIYTMDEGVAQAVVGLLKRYENEIKSLRAQIVGGGTGGPIEVYNAIEQKLQQRGDVTTGRNEYSLRLSYAYRPQTVQGTQPHMVPTIMATPTGGSRAFPVEFVSFHARAPRGVMVPLP
jgi:hypothetical protein